MSNPTLSGNAETALDKAGIAEEQRRVRDAAARQRRKEGLSYLAIRLISLAVVLTTWQLVGAQINPILFTTPIAVVIAAYDMILSGELWRYLAPSLWVLCQGLFFAALTGITLGLALARYRTVDAAVQIYITFLYSTPTVALVPLIVLWAGFENTAKVVILFLFAFFPIVINTYQGAKNVDRKLLEVGEAFRCSEGQLWRHIIIPASLPFIITGLRLGIGRGLIGMVLADLYTAISGIGYLIVRTASTYQIDRMFVPIVTLGLLGILITAVLRWLEVKLAPWTAAGNRE
jgi:NitT/TauT family transport system permease protein